MSPSIESKNIESNSFPKVEGSPTEDVYLASDCEWETYRKQLQIRRKELGKLWGQTQGAVPDITNMEKHD